MWQGKSLIPKPRLNTPRRTAKTPSRIPRPSFQLSTMPAHQVSPNPTIQRGDILAEHVIATGIITSNYAFDRELEDAQYPNPNHVSSEHPVQPSSYSLAATPPKKIRPANIPHAHQPNPNFDFTTPERNTPLRKPAQRASDEELVIDEELVTRTPAKHKNSEWLAGFGIDISLLNIRDDDANEENHDPNVTPSHGFKTQAFDNNESPSMSRKLNYGTTQRRRATDFYGSARSVRESLAGPPTRVLSARKTRRASARISVREIGALKFGGNLEVESQKNDDNNAPRGSEVFLTPVRANRKQREKNGTPLVLSEVRRSLRINTPSSKLVPKNSVRGRIELLEANDHSYIPNPTLSDSASFSG